MQAMLDADRLWHPFVPFSRSVKVIVNSITAPGAGMYEVHLEIYINGNISIGCVDIWLLYTEKTSLIEVFLIGMEPVHTESSI